MAGIVPVVIAHLMVVILHLVLIKVCGIVVMANVFQEALFVMVHLNSVMLHGVLTVLMAQMKA
jgi:hypothetical protein